MTTAEDVEWRPVLGYEDKYEVSTDGAVRSLSSGKELAQWTNNCGYLLTTLTAKGEGTNYLIHRLVAQAFIPNPDAKATVDHINHRRDDNRLSNLRWATHKE